MAFAGSRCALIAVAVSLFVAACSSDPDDNPATESVERRAIESGRETGQDAENAAASQAPDVIGDEQTETAVKVLDLSLPEGMVLEPSAVEPVLEEPPAIFNGEDLFRKDKKKGDVSVTVRPELKAGEELNDIAEIEGASVGIKVKTK